MKSVAEESAPSSRRDFCDFCHKEFNRDQLDWVYRTALLTCGCDNKIEVKECKKSS